jgi:nucleotide-binding universal stress UspA family protein
MKILTPVDGSDTSLNALRSAADLAAALDATLHVVHFADREDDATEETLDRARAVLEEKGVAAEPEVAVDVRLDFRPANTVGEDILEMVEEEGYDHVVMGHHGAGAVGRAILGSAAETVVRANVVPVTVVP